MMLSGLPEGTISLSEAVTEIAQHIWGEPVAYKDEGVSDEGDVVSNHHERNSLSEQVLLSLLGTRKINAWLYDERTANSRRIPADQWRQAFCLEEVNTSPLVYVREAEFSGLVQTGGLATALAPGRRERLMSFKRAASEIAAANKLEPSEVVLKAYNQAYAGSLALLRPNSTPVEVPNQSLVAFSGWSKMKRSDFDYYETLMNDMLYKKGTKFYNLPNYMHDLYIEAKDCNDFCVLHKWMTPPSIIRLCNYDIVDKEIWKETNLEAKLYGAECNQRDVQSTAVQAADTAAKRIKELCDRPDRQWPLSIVNHVRLIEAMVTHLEGTDAKRAVENYRTAALPPKHRPRKTDVRADFDTLNDELGVAPERRYRPGG
jgi:hypothetical protein